MRKKSIEKPKSLKKSFYNFYVPREDESFTIFNSMTGSIINIHNKEKIDKLKNIMNNDIIQYSSDCEIISTLYDNGFLVPENKNEYEFVRYCYERDVVNDRGLDMTLIVTRQCNLRCVYCYEEHENRVMDKKIYDSILEYLETSLKNKVHNRVSIGLFGGEPFVEYDNLIVFLEKANEICQKYDVPYFVSATTNGTLIYPDRFDRLINAGCRYYQITIDGFSDTHDKYRINADGKGSWNQIIENIKYMVTTKHDFKVTVRTNFNDEVFQRAEEFYEYLSEILDERFSVYYEGIKKLGGKKDDQLDILHKVNVDEQSVNIAKKISSLGLNNDLIDAMTLPYSRICYASKHNNLLVDYDGTIMKCTLVLDDDINHVGYIKDGEIVIDSNKFSKWVGAKIDLPDECKNCRVLPICFGGRCINGRVHGESYFCDAKAEENTLEQLISYYN